MSFVCSRIIAFPIITAQFLSNFDI
uniref:Uncharacterized protein n=1 Tax=Rhizophora mucronata TaxID=61149 RepID=A0A2P2QHG5_RHIMU